MCDVTTTEFIKGFNTAPLVIIYSYNKLENAKIVQNGVLPSLSNSRVGVGCGKLTFAGGRL